MGDIEIDFGSLPGHSFILHSVTSLAEPSTLHPFPPYTGLGLLHTRVRDLVPFPQGLLHFVHGDQFEYPPSTKW